MTRGLPGVFPDIKDGQLGMSAGYGAGRRAVIGVCSLGIPNQVYTLTNPSTVRSLLGRGALADAVMTELAQGGGVIYAVPTANSLPGVVTPVEGNPASPAVTVDGAAREALDLLVTVTKGGAVGTAEFVYSLDGGDTLSPAIATSSSYPIPGTSHALKFAAGNYVEGSAYRFGITAPTASMADIEAAFRVLLDGDRDFEFVHVAQPGDNALWTMLDVLAGEAETLYLYPYVIAEAPGPRANETVDEWQDRLLALIRTFSSSSKRVLIVATWGEVVDPNGLQQTRNWAPQFAARVASIPVQENPGWIQRGPIRGVLTTAPFTSGPYGKSSTYNNGHALTLEAAGYTVAYTQRGLKGFYWTEGRMAVPPESDFSILPNRRVMDKAVTLVRRVLLPGVQEVVDPADLEVSLAHRLAKAEAPLKAMKVAGEISSGRVVIPPGQDILSTRRIIVQVRIIPMGYSREIVLDIGFENPALLKVTGTEDARDTESGADGSTSGTSTGGQQASG